MRPDQIAATFSETGADTDGGGVTVTHALAAGKRHFVDAIQASGDKACVVTVESPAGTILYQKRFAAAFVLSETFRRPLKAAVGAAVLIKVSDGTANSEANIQGYTG